MQHLKIKLQQFGALRPAAWAAILSQIEQTALQENENFIRENGTIAFLASGLLKEYDARLRKKPAIINFISESQFFLTRKQNQANFIKACCASTIYFLRSKPLKTIYKQNKDVEFIYDGITESYDDGLVYRQLLLEERTPTSRILLFTQTRRSILPYLKKKDIANFLNIDYNNFVRIYSKLL